MANLELILQQDPHIIQIHPPLYAPVLEIDYNLFSEEKINTIKKMGEIVTNYLSYPLIEDNFQNHEQRRAWRKTMEQTYGDEFTTYYQRNKIRGNSFGYTINALRSMEKNAKEPHKANLTQKIIEINLLYPHNYDSLSSTEKIKTIRTIETKVYALINSLQKPSITLSPSSQATELDSQI